MPTLSVEASHIKRILLLLAPMALRPPESLGGAVSASVRFPMFVETMVLPRPVAGSVHETVTRPAVSISTSVYSRTSSNPVSFASKDDVIRLKDDASTPSCWSQVDRMFLTAASLVAISSAVGGDGRF